MTHVYVYSAHEKFCEMDIELIINYFECGGKYIHGKINVAIIY